MHSSSAELEPSGPPIEVVLGGGDGPSIAIEDVRRQYEGIRVGRVKRVFATLGGLDVHEALVDDDDDEDDDASDDFADEDDATELHEKGSALAGVSLRVAGSGCLGVVGPPGSGKSVLLRTIAGLAPPDAGQVVVDGVVAPILPSVVALLPPRGKLARALPVTAASVRLAPRLVRQRLPEIFELLGEPGYAKLPMSAVKNRRRELVYATMLAIDSDIVLVDLPTPRGAFGERCREQLLERARSGTLVVITAQAAEQVAWIADAYVTMQRGRVLDDVRRAERS